MKNRLGAWAASSSDPTEISNRVKGIVLALSSVIILFASHLFGLTLTPENVVDLAGYIGALSGAIWAVWGGVLALIRWIAEVRD